MADTAKRRKQELAKIVGKTIRHCEAQNFEASDGCFYAVVELEFTDGSMFSFTLRGMPEIRAIFFKDDDDNPKDGDVQLVG